MVTEQEVERMVHENSRLVMALVNRTLRRFPRLPAGYDSDDLRSLGYIGLIRAAQTYDTGRGIAFSTYAYRCIEHTISRALTRESDRQIDCISLSALIGEEADGVLEDQLADQNAAGAADALRRCDRELLESAIATLPSDQARVIRNVYFDEEPIRMVAGKLGLSPTAAQNLHRRALKTLRLRLRCHYQPGAS